MQWLRMTLLGIGLACVGLGLYLGLHGVTPTVTPDSVHLDGPGFTCGSVLHPTEPAPATWEGGHLPPRYKVQPCGVARHDPFVGAVTLGATGVAMLVLCGLPPLWSARPGTVSRSAERGSP